MHGTYKVIFRRLLIGGAAVAALTTGIAEAADETAAVASDSEGLEAVVVTAQRKPEYQKDVPVAVTSLSAQAVSDLSSSGEDIRALAAQVPSLNIESSFGRTYPRFYIRGLGNSDFTYNAQQPVGVVVDDVILENPILKAFPIFDVQDVEVLRGPQGTLFGRNTPAGVVKIDTAKPSDTFGGYAGISYGTFNTVNFTGVVTGPVVPGLLDFRASILEERRDDWVTNINADSMYHRGLEGYTDTAARFQLLYKPTDTIYALLEVDARVLDGTARVFRANIIQPGTNHLIPGFNVDQVDTDGDNYQNLGTWGTHLTIGDDFDGFSVTSVSAYEHGSTRSRGDIDGGNFTGPNYLSPGSNNFTDETSDSIPGLDQFTEELRVATTGDGPLSDQGGFFYFHEYLHVDDFSYNADGSDNNGFGVIAGQKQTTESFGIFDSVKYKATDDLTLGGGLRFSNDNKYYDVTCTFGCAVPNPSSASSNSSRLTFDASGTYAVTEETNVYGRIATGYLAPADDGRNVEFDFGNPAAGALSKAKAEMTTSYEVGLKSSLFEHRANVNLTGYINTTKDMQLVGDGGTSEGTILLNARKVLGEGVESEIEAKPIPQLLLTASASYNFTQIQDPNLEYSGCGDGCNMLNIKDPITGNYHINHNPLPQAPRWILDASARYTKAITDTTDAYISTDWSYRSSVDFFLYRATEFDSQNLLLGNVRIGYVDKARNLEFALFVHNITDEVRVTGALDFDNLTGFVNDPRTLGVEARYKF